MNQGDTELMLGELENVGHEIVEDLDKADIVLVNTCAVTRTTLNRVTYRLKELYDEDDRKIIVAGCLPLIDHGKIEDIGNFSGVISCGAVDQVADVVRRISDGENGITELNGSSRGAQVHRHRISNLSAPVPIAEGCTSNCSYCCVKFARGELKSFEPGRILKQVEEEVDFGRKEIYITTQDTGAYGMDLEDNVDLAYLLDKITSIPGNFMVRVGMMNPKNAKGILDRLLDVYRSEKIYNFLHLPVQSGNNEVLQKMRRDYTVEDFKSIVRCFEENIPNLHLSTDIIVGFPGEDEGAFNDSCKLLREIKPDKVNITRFTPMPNTEAEGMDQIDSEEKKRRSKRMTDLHKEISLEKNRRYVGTVDTGLVLKEGKKGGYEARLKNYKPTIVEDEVPGKFVKIKITEAKPTYLVGEVVG